MLDPGQASIESSNVLNMEQTLHGTYTVPLVSQKSERCSPNQELDSTKNLIFLADPTRNPPSEGPSEAVASGPFQARALGSPPDSFHGAVCPKHRDGGSWTMNDPCEDCISLAFAADTTASRPEPSFRGEDCGAVEGIPSLPMPISARAPRRPVGPSPSLACPRHRNGKGSSILSPCHECLAIAFEADLE